MLGLGLGVTFPRPTGGAPAWTPADLPGVTIWLPPPQGDGVSVVSGGVAQWYNALQPGVTDGGAYQSQSAAYPRLQSSPPALLSDSGEYMSVRPIADTAGPWWLGASFKVPSDASRYLMSRLGGVANERWWFDQDQIDNIFAYYSSPAANIDISASRFVTLILVVTDTAASLYYDNALVTTVSTTTLVGARSATNLLSAGYNFQSSFSEQTFYSVVAGTGALSTDDRGLLSDYLQGVQS